MKARTSLCFARGKAFMTLREQWNRKSRNQILEEPGVGGEKRKVQVETISRRFDLKEVGETGQKLEATCGSGKIFLCSCMFCC